MWRRILPGDEVSRITIRSDLFALGSTIYKTYVGEEEPYERKDEQIQRLISEIVFSTLDGIFDERSRSVIPEMLDVRMQTCSARTSLKDPISPLLKAHFSAII
jgi:hypothetical protein